MRLGHLDHLGNHPLQHFLTNDAAIRDLAHRLERARLEEVQDSADESFCSSQLAPPGPSSVG